MKNNPDNRKDNVEKIQDHIDDTIQNIRKADQMIDRTPDKKMKADLSAKNDRREQALNGMRHEIKDEADWRNSQMKDEGDWHNQTK